jgi:hypothetical protein
MIYDDNLQISTIANISTCNISTASISSLSITAISISTANISTANISILNAPDINAEDIVSNTLLSASMRGTAINVSFCNASTATITTGNITTVNCTNISTQLVGKTSVIGYNKVIATAGGSNTIFSVAFNTAAYLNPSISILSPVTENNPSSTSGMQIQKAGYYKIEVSVGVVQISYNDRCTWSGGLRKTGIFLNDTNYCYTRHSTYGFRGQLNGTSLYLFAVGDWIQYVLKISKGIVTNFTSDFTGVSVLEDSWINLTYLGT